MERKRIFVRDFKYNDTKIELHLNLVAGLWDEEEAGLVDSSKDGLWVNYSLSVGGSPYAATLLGNLKHWLGDDPEIRRLSEALPAIQREIIVRKKA